MTCPFNPATGTIDNDAMARCPVMHHTIPQPPEHLFGLLGNTPDIDNSFFARSLWKLTELYGNIFKLRLGSRETVVISSQELVNDLCDSDRFAKSISQNQEEARALLGDGLFTAHHGNKDWGKAHRLLVPIFGPVGIQNMFDDMLDIASQLILRWDRWGPEHSINTSDEFTRLAFDTIGLCGMGYRFNNFMSTDMHPFATQMGRFLKASGQKALRPGFTSFLHRGEEAQRMADVKAMHDLADEVIAERRRNPKPDAKDVINLMINGVDRETGEKLDDENIKHNLITFLVAGHETTSGTLAFTFWNLLKHPETLHKAQQEVDEVLGDDVITVQHLPKLKYIDACLKETLRRNAPIPGVTLGALNENEVLAKKYQIPEKADVRINIGNFHKDPAVWGDDADEYKPERFLVEGGLSAYPSNSWKPFGVGIRACIGRGLAEQEMLIVMALILQRFQVEMADPSYELKLVSTLTIKPGGFDIKVRRRPGKSMMVGLPGGGASSPVPKDKAKAQANGVSGGEGDLKPLAVYFGGNSGTCEGFAQSIKERLSHHGYEATIDDLDRATEHVPVDQPVLIITSSYEGKPPDNARKFVSWLEKGKDVSLKGVKYSVFGVGNSDWASTFHKVPKLVDEKMKELGATEFMAPGFTNVKEDILGPFEDWVEQLCSTLTGSAATETKSQVTVEITPGTTAQTLGAEKMETCTVVNNIALVDTSIGLAKKHIDIRLPHDMEYSAGDYLVVQPRNPWDSVRRVLGHYALAEDDMLNIKGSSKHRVPDGPVSALEFFSNAVELATPVTKRQLDTLAPFADAEEKEKIEKLKADDAAFKAFQAKRFSILDVITTNAVKLPLGDYIDMLQPLVPRQYSISSSPLVHHDPEGALVSLTYDVHEAAAWSGTGTFHGVASSYLASRQPGDRIHCTVRATNIGFRLPKDLSTPVIMLAAGTGIAPMRAFMLERAAIADAGQRELGPAVLYYGCRSEADLLYATELREWERRGLLTLKPAFSRPDNAGEEKKYAHEVLWEDRAAASALFQAGGKVFLCGSAARLGRSTNEMMMKIYQETHKSGPEEAQKWLEEVKVDRYVSDVY